MTKKKELNNRKLNKVSGGKPISEQYFQKKPCPWCGEPILKILWNNHVNNKNGVSEVCKKRQPDSIYVDFDSIK